MSKPQNQQDQQFHAYVTYILDYNGVLEHPYADTLEELHKEVDELLDRIILKGARDINVEYCYPAKSIQPEDKKNQKEKYYTCTVAFDGTVEIEVRAKSEEEAHEQAEYEFGMMSLDQVWDGINNIEIVDCIEEG